MTTSNVAGGEAGHAPPGESADGGAPARDASSPGAGGPGSSGGAMTHRQVLKALTGLLLALLVAILSSTIVSNALPRITAELNGTQGQYTWVVTAMLLTSTATTPIWGKLSDLFSKKLLYQLSITIFTLGSVLGGFSQSMGMLIGFRAIQGIGMGGMQALIQVVLAAMVAPRDRGRYTGYIGATFAVATTSGPLVGGLIVDSPLGWRWCFWVTAPIAVIAFLVLGRVLRLPVIKRDVSIDWFGALFLVGGVSLLLAWVSLAGKQFDWLSWATFGFVAGGVLAVILAVFVETRVREPIVPLGMFRNPTVSLAIVAMVAVGTAMFGGAVFLAQYFQLGRGYTPTEAGLMTLPMVLGLFVSSTVTGQIISRVTGKIKPFLIGGSLVLTLGMGLLSTIDSDTPLPLVDVYLALMGIGVGALMQNLVLAVQNSVDIKDMGSVTSVVTFFRTLGGSAGVSVLGAVLGSRVSEYAREGMAELPGPTPSLSGGNGSVSLDVNSLPAPIEAILHDSYGRAIGDLFLITACVSVVTLLAVLFIREVPLRTTVEKHDQPAEGGKHRAVENLSESVDNSSSGGDGSVAGAPSSAQPITHEGHISEAVERPVNTSSDPVDNSVEKSVENIGENSVGGRSAALSNNGFEMNEHSANGVSLAGSLYPDDGAPTVYGVVRGPGGVPLAGVVLTLTDSVGNQVDRTHSDDLGNYRVKPAGGGTCVLIAAADDYQPSAAMVAISGRTVRHDVELSGGAGLSGMVHSGPVPVPDATVVLTDVRGSVVAAARTGGGGGYEFKDLVGGSYALTVTAEGYQPTSTEVALPEGQRATLDVSLESGAEVRGVIRSARLGHAVPEAQVTLLDSSGGVVAATVTGPDGEYRFTDLSHGDYTVIATGYAPTANNLSVRGEHVDHDIALGLE
ncbi:drug resistance transporter, EmrB/QacA subfamily [Actinopolyspora mzabensis]|uniref:Drug resistance transporter, EmrB/QacA subfamily n=1 Tax=Actinopolyspora mzabensis TaxID=995066 RepID=A0A1G8XBY6_ACTMZ|nr:MFS transporter [Actinopolyspora mzabensis]SDJ87857.1 drug resistance transporter, EmrB/QacA subfamily [Actinopolyspora mzabensis]